MNWDALGAIAELLGAIAVLATLIYLSLQIRQNSRALERTNTYALSDSIHNVNRLHHEVFSVLSTDGELADIYTRCLEGEHLTKTEATRFSWLVNSYLAYVEFIWHQQLLDLGFTAEADEVFSINGPFIRKLLASDAGMNWWRTDAQNLFLDDFRNKIDAVIDEGDA